MLAGTIDAWAEAYSVGVQSPGDLMIMYGSTLFLIGVDPSAESQLGLWRTAGLSPQAGTLAAGMATAGLLASWVAETARLPLADLMAAAANVPAGAGGLVLLPYFAGERSPIFDPGARGVAVGLTLTHTPAHLMRAALEAVAMGVRHNLEAFDLARTDAAGWRAVAVGGGSASGLWPQLVSDVTGRVQAIPEQAIGASYGDALLAAVAAELVSPGTDWTTIEGTVRPRPELHQTYSELYGVYRDLFTATRPLLARLQPMETQQG